MICWGGGSLFIYVKHLCPAFADFDCLGIIIVIVLWPLRFLL